MSEVLVVGAGLAGLSVAAHLAPHRAVRVLEQGEAPAAEASAQNAGMVRLLSDDPVERALAWRTHQRLAALDGPDAPSRITGGVLALAHDPLHLHGAVAWLAARGATVEDLGSHGQIAAVAPVLAGAPVRRAWHLPEARVADAHQLASGFLATLRAHGGSVSCGTAVCGLHVVGGRCVGVETTAGIVAADHVVLAAGAWSASLAASAGLHRPLFPLRRSLLQTVADPLAVAGHPWTWLDDIGLYVRPEGGGWLGSPCDEAVDFPSPGPGSRGPVAELPRALFADKLARFLPRLSGLRPATGWTGLRTFAPDRRPLLGADGELPGLCWAAGLGGFGVSTALAVGEAVAADLRGEPVDWLDLSAVRPHRRMLSRWLIRPQGWLEGPRLVSGQLPPRIAR